MTRLSPYASASATQVVLEAHGLAAKKSLGQNFLVSDNVVGKILDLAGICDDDVVLEVGPGIGTLTAALLQHAGGVVAVERDADLCDVLVDTLAPWQDRLTLIRKDALDLVCSDMAGLVPGKLVANLPYAVAATVVLDYLRRFEFLESATVMVQREVAERMMAAPGTKSYGAYTVKLALLAEPGRHFSASPNNFLPRPHVDSMVLRLDRRVLVDEFGAPASRDLVDAACTMADAAFANRRKTILNSCKAYFSVRADDAGRVVDARRTLDTGQASDAVRAAEENRHADGRRAAGMGRGSDAARAADAGQSSDAHPAAGMGRGSDAVRAADAGCHADGHRDADAGRTPDADRTANARRTVNAGRVVQVLSQILEEAGIDASLRGEVLRPDDFVRLGRAYLNAI